MITIQQESKCLDRSVLDKLRKSYTQDEVELKNIERVNKIVEKITIEENISNSNLLKMNKLINVCNGLKRTVLACGSTYHKTRKSILEMNLNKHLEYVFPGENFIAEMSKTMVGGKEAVVLLSGYEGHLQPSKAQHGRLMRQLLSTTVLYTINKLRGSTFLFMDEPFSSGDSETLESLKPVLDMIINSGFQVNLTEHKHILYENMSRRTYYMHKDINKRKVVIDRWEDSDGL